MKTLVRDVVIPVRLRMDGMELSATLPKLQPSTGDSPLDNETYVKYTAYLMVLGSLGGRTRLQYRRASVGITRVF